MISISPFVRIETGQTLMLGRLKKHALAKAQGPSPAFPAFAGPTPPKATKAGSGFAFTRYKALHRASVQAGPSFVVLTYSFVRSTRQKPCGLARGKARLGVHGLGG